MSADLVLIQFALAVLDEADRVVGFVAVGRENAVVPHVATAVKFATVAEAYIRATALALHQLPGGRIRAEVVRVVEPIDAPSLVRFERLPDLEPIGTGEGTPPR